MDVIFILKERSSKNSNTLHLYCAYTYFISFDPCSHQCKTKLALSLLNENLRVMGVALSFICLSHFCLWPHCVAYGILLPGLGIEPRPSALGTQSFNTWTTREVPLLFLPSFPAGSSWSHLPNELLVLEPLCQGLFLAEPDTKKPLYIKH